MHIARTPAPLSGATPEAIRLFDAATEAFALYRGDPVGLLDQAIAIAPRFAMARLFKGWLFALTTEPEAAEAARGILADAIALPLGTREAGHAEALSHVLAGNWSAGGLALERHSMLFPLDLPALQAGHLIDFYRANARALRDRIARALPHWQGVPGRSLLLGMHAFGLEETGDHTHAEAVGREAVETDPRDCWAHHAVAHVMEMQGRPADGLAWMAAREPHWADEDNFFRVHNWWHRALCHIELGDTAAAIALYDGPVRGARSPIAVDLVDASALLWRLDLSGVDVGDRWDELSAAWDAQADGRVYAFNDWHAAMAHLGAGRLDEMARLLAAARKAEGSEAARWMRETGVPLMEGFAAFRRGDHATAVERLLGARHISNVFGGSHAQRDVIDWTLTEAAIRGGLSEVAEGLAQERIALRPHSPVNRRFLERARAR
ncbi:tetratricopeptide repeat protein [Falsiroseomonas sp.]|uniref:tetratricopeptide repeat protein n=1 Tax=Falsiroseomonas sp. TaxID=2870721 RepID=UPI00271FCBFC|nr:tetratricopeptide repeat protein [Falsiroseomonas sp.]MDO9500758.1 tetratricopeptide repeat protein [Falsiroseomonas sp.]